MYDIGFSTSTRFKTKERNRPGCALSISVALSKLIAEKDESINRQ
jgi:hypothetical protein